MRENRRSSSFEATKISGRCSRKGTNRYRLAVARFIFAVIRANKETTTLRGHEHLRRRVFSFLIWNYLTVSAFDIGVWPRCGIASAACRFVTMGTSSCIVYQLAQIISCRSGTVLRYHLLCKAAVRYQSG